MDAKAVSPPAEASERLDVGDDLGELLFAELPLIGGHQRLVAGGDPAFAAGSTIDSRM